MIKALVTDVDGTITDGKRQVHLKAVEGLRLLERTGIPVMLATGNVEPIAKGLSTYMGTSGPIIAENGGVVSYKGRRSILSDRTKPDIAFEHVSKHLSVRKVDTDLWRVTEVALIMDVSVEEVRKLLQNFEGVKVNTTGFAIHIHNSGINKGSALEVACSLLNVDLEEIVAIGDSENDIEMIEKAGMGVAVKNASSKLRDRADITLEEGGGEGFYEFMEDLVSRGQKRY